MTMLDPGQTKTSEDADGSNIEGNESDNMNIPTSPFVTTSDVIENLNKQLALLSDPSSDGIDDSIASTGPLQQLQPPKPKFELQKRLPDGSTIPATADEISAADFKTKLEQAAAFVSQLATSRDRQYWAEQQRGLGNSFFSRGDYKSAMDVYLTCLLVKENTPDFVGTTLLPVLNNLAQCTLQLGMYKKTIAFCSIAIDEMGKVHKSINDETSDTHGQDDDDKLVTEPGHGLSSKIQEQTQTDSNRDLNTSKKSVTFHLGNIDTLALCKIYFKKAKAERLSGLYEASRQDLNYSLDFLEQKGHQLKKMKTTTEKDNDKNDGGRNCDGKEENNTTAIISLEPYHQAIQKEYRYLDVAEKEARRNQHRQKRAMQKILSTSHSKSVSNEDRSTSNSSSLDQEASTTSNHLSLYDDKIALSGKSRQFSSLRSRKKGVKNSKKQVSSSTKTKSKPSQRRYTESPYQSAVHYYWTMVARVTQSLLILLGDDDDNSDDDEDEHDDE